MDVVNNNEEIIELCDLCFNICVNYEVDNDFLESTPVRPVIVDGQIDDQSLADYQSFILELLLGFDDMGFKEKTLIDCFVSESNEATKDLALVDVELYEDNGIEQLIKIRATYHMSRITYQQLQLIDQKPQDKASKVRLKWKAKSVTVNDRNFITYDEASEYVCEIVSEYKNYHSIEGNA